MNGNPFYNPYGGGFSNYPLNYYPMNGMNSLYYPWGGINNMGMMNNNMGNNVNRYYAENVAIISFEPDGKWSGVM